MFSITAIAISVVTLAVPAMSSIDARATTVYCNGIPGGLYWNGTEITTDKETRVEFSYQLSNIISGAFFYNGHGGAPCTSLVSDMVLLALSVLIACHSLLSVSPRARRHQKISSTRLGSIEWLSEATKATTLSWMGMLTPITTTSSSFNMTLQRVRWLPT